MSRKERAPTVGRIVWWNPPAEVRAWDVGERIGEVVACVIARVHPDGAVDLHALLPPRSPLPRVEVLERVPFDPAGAPGSWRSPEA